MSNNDYSYSILKNLGMSDAGALQTSIKRAEAEQLDKMGGYSKEHVSQAIVHTRQDLILIYSNIDDINKKSSKLINRLDIVIILLGALLAFDIYTNL